MITKENRLLLHDSDGAVFVSQEELFQLSHLIPQKSYFILAMQNIRC